MSAVLEEPRQEEITPERAGLFSWFKKLKFRTAQPKAGSPEDVSSDQSAPRMEPKLDVDDKQQGASDDLKTDLLSSIARIWQQVTVDTAAFEKIKHFKVENSPFEGTMALVNDEDDIIYFGINPKDGSHAVMSPANISARHALEQVYVALTDDLMRTEGIDDVNGTDLDKALLCLAAEKNGLKINNVPPLSDEIKAQALKLWQESFPEVSPEAAPAADKTVRVDGSDILPAPLAENEAITAETSEDAQIIDAEFTEVTPTKAAEALSAPAPMLALDDAPPSVIILGYTPDTPAQDVIITEVAATPGIKPAALDILHGDTPENAVSPETFLDFVSALKDGDYSDDQGMLSEDVIHTTFTRPVHGATEADVLLKAAVAQGVIYDTTKTVPALRMVINPHVVSPVRYDPNRKVEVATAQQETTSASEKILAQARIRAETYEDVKKFVGQREGDIIRPADLVHEFAAKAGVGATKAHALLAALEADALTQVEGHTHRVVAKAAPVQKL